MSYSRNGEFIPDWFHTKTPPEHYSSKLFYFEPGCEYGGKDEDGVTWYRIRCNYWFGDWIETHNPTLWRPYGRAYRAIYIVHEKLMTLIRLQWLT